MSRDLQIDPSGKTVGPIAKYEAPRTVGYVRGKAKRLAIRDYSRVRREPDPEQVVEAKMDKRCPICGASEKSAEPFEMVVVAMHCTRCQWSWCSSDGED